LEEPVVVLGVVLDYGIHEKDEGQLLLVGNLEDGRQNVSEKSYYIEDSTSCKDENLQH
jgi:hypothetical protein